jgi:SAM-dependent methyltransferase
MAAPIKSVPVRPVQRNVEELDGGQGREVFFRPHRYRAHELEPLRSRIIITLAGETHSCALQDVSQNGVAFEWPRGVPVSVGDRIESLIVSFDTFEAYRGEARVGSLRDVDGTQLAGVSFDNFLLSVDEVLNLRSIRAWKYAPEKAAWHATGQEKFKAQVAELRLFFEDAEVELQKMEADLPWHVLHGDVDSPAREALIEQLRHGFAADVVRQIESIDADLRSAPATVQPALLAYSRRYVHDFLMRSPCLHRMLHKPFGYPGDYEMMRFIYERNFEGVTLFGKAVNLGFVETSTSKAVKFRKDLVKHQLHNLIESRRGSDKPLRILSVAAGPAQELLELLEELDEVTVPLEIVLFDQDKGSLAYAFRRLRPKADKHRKKRVQILYLHDSIKRLLRDAKLFAQFGEFDYIYSSGLFDYLQASTAVILTRNLFARLAPGGKLLVGNMVPENPGRWIMEQHLDWHLIYRSRAEQLEIARRAAPSARVQILEEETGVNPFVELTRE